MYDAELAKKERNKIVVKSLVTLLDMEEVAAKDPEYVKRFFEINPDAVKTLMQMDAFQLAEQITGRSYKGEGNEDVSMMGLGLHMKINKLREIAMKSLGDTHYGMDLGEFVNLLNLKGFQLVYQEEFERDGYSNGCKDDLYVYIHRADAVLLIFDSYNKKSVNGGQFHYCWKPSDSDQSKRWGVTSSGGWESTSEPGWRKREDNSTPDDLYWRGYHDCREAMFGNIQQLKSVGVFLSPWPHRKAAPIEMPLSTGQDYNNAKAAGEKPGCYAMVNAERIRRYNLLPDDVKNLLNFEFEVK